MNWLRERPFQAMLASLILVMLVFPVLLEIFQTRVFYGIFFSLFFLAAFRVVFRHRRNKVLAIVLGLPTLIGVWVESVFTGRPPQTFGAIMESVAILFLIHVIVTILNTVYHQAEVSIDGVAGALCGYILVGLAFAHGYTMIEVLYPGSFMGAGDFAAEFDTHGYFVFTYFSFTTLTTVGFGDVVPARGVTRALAMVEAITGQFYLAVLIGDLIGKRVATALSVRGSKHS